MAVDYSQLPSVHALADDVGEVAPRWAVVEAARRMIAAAREALTGGRDGAINAEDVAVLAGQLADLSRRTVEAARQLALAGAKRAAIAAFLAEIDDDRPAASPHRGYEKARLRTVVGEDVDDVGVIIVR